MYTHIYPLHISGVAHNVSNLSKMHILKLYFTNNTQRFVFYSPRLTNQALRLVRHVCHFFLKKSSQCIAKWSLRLVTLDYGLQDNLSNFRQFRVELKKTL